MMMMNERILQFARILLRFALGVTFLVSVADRFGFVCFNHECRAWRRRAFELLSVHGIRRNLPSRCNCCPGE
jgi:hypothetical protein